MKLTWVERVKFLIWQKRIKKYENNYFNSLKLWSNKKRSK